MKLGASRLDPESGQRGEVIRLVGPHAYCRTKDGMIFRIGARRIPRPTRPSAGRPCRIEIREFSGLVFDGVTTAIDRARITSPDPLWYGCDVSRHDAKITFPSE